MIFVDSDKNTIHHGDFVEFYCVSNEIKYMGVGIFQEDMPPYIVCNDEVIEIDGCCTYRKLSNVNASCRKDIVEFMGKIVSSRWTRTPKFTHIIEFETFDGQKFEFGNIDFLQYSASKYLNVLMSVVGPQIDSSDLIGKVLHCSVQDNKIVAIADFNGRISIMDLRNLYDEEV
jgi:hypothetical protein